jgi:hypothetical protein
MENLTERDHFRGVNVDERATFQQVNLNKSPTRCNSFSVYYPDVYLHLNMLREFSRPSTGAQ